MTNRTLTDAERKLFFAAATYWQRELGLDDWHITQQSEPSKKNLRAAVCEWDNSQRTCLLFHGTGWSEKTEPAELERIALHEMLHVRLFDIAQTAIWNGADKDDIIAMEHQNINVLLRLLPVWPGLREGKRK